MANEISYDEKTGLALYMCRFQPGGNVFLTDGASDEVWGAGPNDADNYDVAMTENGSGGHYVGNFDGASIAAGLYPVVVYLRATGVPIDSDIAIGRSEMHWDGSAEINASTIDTLIDTVDGVVDAILVDTDTMEADLKTYLDALEVTVIGEIDDNEALLDTIGANVDILILGAGTVTNIYNEYGSSGGIGIPIITISD